MTGLIERLRGGPNSYDSETEEVMVTAADALEAATAREAALVAQSQTVLQREAETTRRYDATVEALTAENERLREALRYMADTSLIDDDYRDIARAALEAKP